MAKISIIIPIYNVEKYVAQVMESVVNQTMRDIEIICVNDCGTDNSMQIVNQFAKKDTRIKVINNPHNMGIADTRNVGLNAATAPYIMWCDPDDWMQPDMCEKMYNAITKNKSDIAVCGTNVVYETDNKIAKTDIGYFNIANNETVDVSGPILGRTNVALWNKIFRHNIIEKYNLRFPSGKVYEDSCFFRMYMCHANKITFITDKLYNYRRRRASIMNKTFNKRASYWMDALHVVIEYQKHMDEYGLWNINYDDFWRHVFVPEIGTLLLNAKNRKNRKIIYSVANEFISHAYTHPTIDTYVHKNIELIQQRKYVPQFCTYMMGLAKYTRTFFRTEFRIGPLSIYKKKLSDEIYSTYILGIPIHIDIFNSYIKFITRSVRKNSVLVIEFNGCHGEVIGTMVKYLDDLGYKIDVLINTKTLNEQPFCRQKISDMRIYKIRPKFEKIFLHSRNARKYAHVFLMTSAYYYTDNPDGKYKCALPFFNGTKLKPYVIEHDLNDVKKFCEDDLIKSNHLITLGKFNRGVFVNAHDFGETKKLPRHTPTTFITVGNIEGKRKNFDILVDAAQKLAQHGAEFKIIVVGRGNVFKIPADIRQFFEITGRLNFPDMFEKLESADFFLPLLDPDNPAHDRYLTTGVTGSAQLIYGFAKVPVIHSKFADFYRFNNSNAIVYSGDMTDAMLHAINMTDTEYEKLRQSLKQTADEIKRESINNLREILK